MDKFIQINILPLHFGIFITLQFIQISYEWMMRTWCNSHFRLKWQFLNTTKRLNQQRCAALFLLEVELIYGLEKWSGRLVSSVAWSIANYMSRSTFKHYKLHLQLLCWWFGQLLNSPKLLWNVIKHSSFWPQCITEIDALYIWDHHTFSAVFRRGLRTCSRTRQWWATFVTRHY